MGLPGICFSPDFLPVYSNRRRPRSWQQAYGRATVETAVAALDRIGRHDQASARAGRRAQYRLGRANHQGRQSTSTDGRAPPSTYRPPWMVPGVPPTLCGHRPETTSCPESTIGGDEGRTRQTEKPGLLSSAERSDIHGHEHEGRQDSGLSPAFRAANIRCRERKGPSPAGKSSMVPRPRSLAPHLWAPPGIRRYDAAIAIRIRQRLTGWEGSPRTSLCCTAC